MMNVLKLFNSLVMYRVDRNNFYKDIKNATVYTPSIVSDFLYKILSPFISNGLILDPCVGGGFIKTLKKKWL